jgi:tetratricopeptide (TPR) repeat protein
LQAGLREAAEFRVAQRYDDAVSFYTQIEERNPEAVDAPYFLAMIDLARRQPVSALRRLEALSRRLPNEPKVWTALAYARRDLGQWSAALEALDQVERLDPFAAALDRPVALEVLGRIDEAVAFQRRMAENPSTRLAALIGLTRLRPAAITAMDKSVMERAAQTVDLKVATRIELNFALGAIEEQLGNPDAAFAAYSAANRLKRQTMTGELPPLEQPPIGSPVRAIHPDAAADEHRAMVAFRKAVFTPAFIAEYEGRGHHIAAPIFVLGMPRSGSTLLEQILSSHHRVQGLGETTSLAEAAAGRYPFDLFGSNPPDHFRRLADAYFKGMHDRGWSSAPRFVDKMLRNYMDIGLIHLMLPKATILHSVRDPVDTCLACYRQLFETGHEVSYDLGDIGREYVRYREMMDHWAAVLPGRVIDVSHEKLIAHPEAQTRWLITEACGLDWDPACLRFYETKRPVRTASVAQVRRPIFTTSVERWHRYEKHLGPLFEALGPYAPAARTLDRDG